MISLQYSLKKPFLIEERLSFADTDGGRVIVRPKMLSICKADMRYYFGLRDPKTLAERLPMALIHEACGEVLFDPNGTFKKGTKAVLLPNIAGKDTFYGENYRLDSVFRSSRADGFMQELVALDKSCLIAYPRELPDEIMCFTEFISVAVHAANSFDKKAHERRDSIGIWGDGALAYVVCCVLKRKFPRCRVTVIGKNYEKMQFFTAADEVVSAERAGKETVFDHAFECVGGNNSAAALEQIIRSVRPEGTVILLGVSEEKTAVDTRTVLEKGLTLLGRSRSGREDFAEAVGTLREDKTFLYRMRPIISAIVEIKSIEDIGEAFDKAKTVNFKVVMDWKI